MSRRGLVVVLMVLLGLLSASLPVAAQTSRDRDVDFGGATDGDSPEDAPDRGDGTVQHRAVATRTTVGATRTYRDADGVQVDRVEDGFDLDQYLFRNASPLNFSIDLSATTGGAVTSDGHPLPGHPWYDEVGRLTVRAYDVDDQSGEVDKVVVNGVVIDGTHAPAGPRIDGILSGANNQWSINTFDVPLRLLRQRTTANPTGRNDFEILIDVNNGSWAVEIDWAELRTHPIPTPLVALHGITGNGDDNGNGCSDSMQPIVDYFRAQEPRLQGRSICPPLSKNESVQENRNLLLAPVNQLVRDTGATEVNLLAHSMGGLNSRLYAWDFPHRVDQVQMIATPNGGSTSAEVACAGRWGLLGLVGGALSYFTRDMGDCTGPEDGLYQLQSWYVQDVFNAQVRDHDSIRYAVIAGDKPQASSVSLWGPDDGAVTVESAFWLRGADQSVAGLGRNDDHPGEHVALLPVYDRTHSTLMHAGSPAHPHALCSLYRVSCDQVSGTLDPVVRRATVRSTDAAAPVQPWELIGAAQATLDADGRASIPLAFDGAAAASVQVLSDGGVDGTLHGQPLVDDVFLDVPARGLVLSQATDGVLELAGPAGQDVLVLVRGVTDARLTSSATPALALLGDAVTIAGTAPALRPGEQLSVVVVDPDGTRRAPITVQPAADGTFSLQVPTTAAGEHQVFAELTGGRLRLSTTGFTVTAGAAAIGTATADVAVDTNANGLYDELRVTVPVTVGEPGTYRITADLRGADGTVITSAGATADLPAGGGDMTVAFDGSAVYEAGLDGAYRITDVVLADAGLQVLAVAADAGSTRTHIHQAFEHARVLIDRQGFSSQAHDIDGNGRFDVLRVTTSVRTDRSGTHAINARLLAADGTEIARTQQVRSLPVGWSTITLEYPGLAIGESGQHGPYTVADLSVYPTFNSDAVDFAVAPHVTTAYRNVEFEGGTAAALAIDPDGFSDAAVDVDADGFLDLLEVVGTATGASAGEHAVRAVLRDTTGAIITEVATTIVLPDGGGPFTLPFDGQAIGRHGGDGPFTVTALVLHRGDDPSVSAALDPAWTTAAYDVDAFAGAATFGWLARRIAIAEGDGTLGAGIARSLLAKVDAAESSAAEGRTQAADNQLRALVQEIEAQRGKEVPEPLAEELLELVGRVRSRL